MARQPEGRIKDLCRPIAKRLGLLFEQVESKSRNGWPDTLAGKFPKGSGVIHIEFKVPGKEPNEQQYLRIAEINENGGEATWVDSVDGYRKAIGLS